MKKLCDQAWFDERWFCSFKPQFKLAWMYIWMRSDLVGVWDPNLELANFQLSHEIKWEEFLKENQERIKVLGNGKWWLMKYCPFQFGDFSPTSRVHQAAKRTLNGHGISDEDSLWIAYQEPTSRLIVKSKSESCHDKEEKVRISKPTREECARFAEDKNFLKSDGEFYWDDREVSGWKLKGGAPIKDWKLDFQKWGREGWLHSQKQRNGNGINGHAVSVNRPIRKLE